MLQAPQPWSSLGSRYSLECDLQRSKQGWVLNISTSFVSNRLVIHTHTCTRPLQLYEVGLTEDSSPSLAITVPRSEASGYVNNKKEIYAFK